jgi:hypothetical protein
MYIFTPNKKVYQHMMHEAKLFAINCGQTAHPECPLR